jgi:hypothetical protein
MVEKELAWTIKLDWLNILTILGLESIDQIPDLKKEKALRKITRTFGAESLLELEPSELDNMVAIELKELMKKELISNQRKEEKDQEEMKSKFIPFKQGGIIKIDPRDFKDIDVDPENPEDFLKALYKKLVGKKDDDEDKDEDKNNVSEDSTGYYI